VLLQKRAMRIAISVVLAAASLSWLVACGQPPAAHAPPAPAGIRAENPVLHVEDAWAAPTPGGVDVAAGYLTIVNGADADDTLIGAESPRATRVDLHEMTMAGSVMQMRTLPSLPVAAHTEVTLAPGGRHLMFNGVKQAFIPGDDIPVDLTFAHAGKIHVVLPVRAPS
jgi:copper(I)-binding protein